MSKFKRGALVYNPNTNTIILVAGPAQATDEFTGVIVQSDVKEKIGTYRDDWSAPSFKTFPTSVTITTHPPQVGELYGDEDDCFIFVVLKVDGFMVEGMVIHADADDLFTVGEVTTFETSLYMKRDI